MSPTLNRLVMYVRDTEQMVAFYCSHFGYRAIADEADRIVELQSGSGGLTLLFHPAAKGQKQGQAQVKLVFDVADVQAARIRLIQGGIEVGPIHNADGYQFANLKDPSLNSISISSRAYRTSTQ